MSDHRHHRRRELFEAALELPVDQRVCFLCEQCGDDHALRREVENLLEHDQSAGASFLGKPIDPLPTPLGNGTSGIGIRMGNAFLPHEPLPRTVGPYEIVRLIGAGGMGAVYEARQLNPSRIVALKVVRPDFVARGAVARFLREAHILGQLQHPGIAQIYEAGMAPITEALDSPSRPYFAMELVQGLALHDHVKQTHLGIRGRVELVAHVCDALQHAHERGVIHRDLKPDNILIDRRGRPKILDFGIARLTNSDVQVTTLQTDIGQLIGTMAYMSPEQVAGDSKLVDGRSDIYALGVILYELLSGRLPHEIVGRSIAEAARIIRDEDASALSSIDTALRGDLDVIVAKALEKDKERRYQSAAELAEDLRRYLHDQPILSRPASRMYQIRKFARRNKGLVGGLAATMFVLLVGVIVAGSFAIGERKERHRAQENEIHAQRTAYRASIAAASTALASRDIGLARRSLEDAPTVLRGWEWRYLSANLDHSLRAIESPYGVPTRVYFLSGKDRIAAELRKSAEDKSCARWDTSTGYPLDPAKPIKAVNSYCISRNGLFEARFDQGASDVVVEDLSSGQRRVFPLIDMRLPVGFLPEVLDVSNDGTRVALTATSRSGDSRLGVLQFGDASQSACVVATEDFVDVGAFSFDGYRLATAQSVGSAGVWDAATCTPVISLPRFQNRVSSLDFSPDGVTLSTGSYAGMIRLWNADDGRLLASVRGHSARVSSVRFAPIETPAELWSASEDRTIKLWNAESMQLVAEYHGHSGAIQSMEVSPDGSRLVTGSADRTLRIWDATIRGDLHLLRGHENYVYPVVLSPDGRRILSGGWEGYIGKPGCTKLWDADTGQLIAEWGGPDERVLDAAYSPSGSLMAVATIVGDTARVHVYDALSGRSTNTLTVTGGLTWISLSFIGGSDRVLVETSDGTLRLWDPHADEVQWSAVVGAFVDDCVVASTVAGRLVANGSPGHLIQVRDAVTLTTVNTLQGHTAKLRALAFCPDGSLLASASEDGTVRIWNSHSGALIATLTGHTDGVLGVTFSPDGSRMASCGRDQVIRIWNTTTFEELAQLTGHSSYVYSVAFSPDGTSLISGSGDHTIRIWGTDPFVKRIANGHERVRLVAELGPLVQQLTRDLERPDDVVVHLLREESLERRRREIGLQLVFRETIQNSEPHTRR